jgi:hypothetical protein
MNKFIVLLIATTLALTGCVAYEVPGPRSGHDGYQHDGYHRGGDRDRDGIPNRADRDRDGDGVRNRDDRRPDDPRRN